MPWESRASKAHFVPPLHFLVLKTYRPYEFGTEAVGDGDDVDDDINVVFVSHSNMYFSQVSS